VQKGTDDWPSGKRERERETFFTRDANLLSPMRVHMANGNEDEYRRSESLFNSVVKR